MFVLIDKLGFVQSLREGSDLRAIPPGQFEVYVSCSFVIPKIGASIFNLELK